MTKQVSRKLNRENEPQYSPEPFSSIYMRYKYLLNRVVKGYSVEEIAFLLGRTETFVNKFETTFGKVDLNIEDVECLSVLYQCHISDFVDCINPHEIYMVRINHGGGKQGIFYEALVLYENKPPEALFTVFDPYRTNQHEDLEEAALNEAKAVIFLLIEEGFFDGKIKAGHEVFFNTIVVAEVNLSPRHIQTILNQYLASGLLQMVTRNKRNGQKGYIKTHNHIVNE